MRFFRRIIVLMIAACALVLFCTQMLTPPNYPRVIIDHVGRAVPVPHEIRKVYATTQAGSMLVYALNPELLLAWNTALPPNMEYVFGNKARALPTLGTWDDVYKTVQLDEIAALKPDVVIHLAVPDLPTLDLAIQIEEALGIPTVVVDGSLEAIPSSLRFLSQILGSQVRADALALFAENSLNRLAVMVENLPRDPTSVYIAGKTNTLDLKTALRLTGVKESPSNFQADLVLIAPDPILDLSRTLLRDPPPQAEKAIANGAVYQIPTVPQNWFAAGSLFRLLGIEWLAQTAYPELFPLDVAEKYREFMEVFYEVRLSDELVYGTLGKI